MNLLLLKGVVAEMISSGTRGHQTNARPTLKKKFTFVRHLIVITSDYEDINPELATQSFFYSNTARKTRTNDVVAGESTLVLMDTARKTRTSDVVAGESTLVLMVMI